MRKNEKKFIVEMNQTQLCIIQRALESFFRCRYNQFHDLADDLAFAGYKREEDDEKASDFNRRIKARCDAEELFKAAGNIARPPQNRTQKTEECMIAEDMWAVIRHEQYIANGGKMKMENASVAHPPLMISDEEPIIVNEKK